MVHLVTVASGFQARVIAARLGSEGIVTSLRGALDGPYPFGDVAVLVDAHDVELARQLLLADEVEEALSAPARDGAASHRVAGLNPRVAVAAAVLVAVATSLVRILTI